MPKHRIIGTGEIITKHELRQIPYLPWFIVSGDHDVSRRTFKLRCSASDGRRFLPIVIDTCFICAQPPRPPPTVSGWTERRSCRALSASRPVGPAGNTPGTSPPSVTGYAVAV
jgi:hypothetical protein